MASNDLTITQQPLNSRCLALTGAFETSSPPPACFGVVTGNFDGQGISFSALQWNLGQGTLQTFLSETNTRHPETLQIAFGDLYPDLLHALRLPHDAQLAWASSIQTPKFVLFDQWAAGFHKLGLTSEFQAIALAHSSTFFQAGLATCSSYGLHSQRAAALFFDIRVQNGAIGTATEARIRQDFAALPPGDPTATETAKLVIIARRVAGSAIFRYRQDVLDRKLAIANGVGTVHRVQYDLARQYDLTLAAI